MNFSSENPLVLINHSPCGRVVVVVVSGRVRALTFHSPLHSSVLLAPFDLTSAEEEEEEEEEEVWSGRGS